MENKRLKILKEEAVVNEVTLNDLLDLASKVAIAAMQLNDACMKFNSAHLRQLAASISKDVSDLRDEINAAIIGNAQEQEVPKKQPIEQPESADNMIESLSEAIVKKVLRKIKESVEETTEETPEETTSEETAIETETAPEAAEESTTTPKAIDLTSAFDSVIEGLTDEQFADFKSQVVTALKGSGETAPEYQEIVNEVEATETVDDFNFALDKLYDYADENGIEIKTTSEAGETTEEETEEIA